MKPVLLAVVFLFFHQTAISTGFGAETGARATAWEFYDVLMDLQVRGLPSTEELKIVEPFLSADILAKFSVARKEQEKVNKKNETREVYRQIKPPWIEGNLFGSSWGGMTSFSLGRAIRNGKMVSIPVYLKDGSGAAAAKWVDVIILTKEKGMWKVYDIYFNAPWDFRNHGSLRRILPKEDRE